MSSEQMVSIGGSEEVRALEYGDMSMTSESSNSERTEEGVGRGEVVGVEGDRVPIMVVEVEGMREMCYDVDADIVSEVKQYESELGTRDSLGYLVESYEISSRVLIRPVRVELLSSWKAKKANQNKYSLNEDKEEEVGKLVREGGKLANIMSFTSVECVEAAELYGPSALSEAEMDKFLNAIRGVAIPKKPRKKSKTSTKEAGEGGAGKELVPSTSAGVEKVVSRLELKRKGSEEVGALQRKKKVVEEEVRGSEVLQFVPRPPLVELDLELKESKAEEAEVRALGKGKGLWRFINATFPEVDKCQARDEALRYCGATVVKHVLEKEKEKLEKKHKDMQEVLDEVVPAVKQLEQERDSLSTKLVFEEKKRKISESECKAQEKEIKAMKEAVVELKKNVQLLLPTAILAFTDCRKKVEAEYPEVDITKITFGEQEEGVEENNESMLANFYPQIKLRWDCDAEGRTVFPPNFDFEFVAVEEEEAEVEETEVGAGAGGAEVDEGQPPLQVEVHPVPSDDEQPPLPTK
ncbi:hypothetical protein SLEP1_g3958 [Rubroshorea leprosula]|uniref:Uncharacterized protein n=1 Tax=Rubroshorea leprosula TaxID=152421 RepID=A0AAV5HW01_9ROSI|nr:hypothetical protein SLEP1_g3958 [Rubroshorea leprosula]